ncbi:MAG: spheroidene monooxygenase [Cytophagales bacterium]|nr:spheroidene monooxygenase [Cytophagales bacterium]
MSQITTVTFFRFSNAGSRFWALKMMGMAHRSLMRVEGQSFYKLMGSGRGYGFNPWPDWSVYSLLQVWDNEEHAMSFFKDAPVWLEYKQKASETWSLFMRSLAAHGVWTGVSPFSTSENIDPHNKRVAVITRATIKWHKLARFWAYVPTSQRPVTSAQGLIYTKGIGEVPLVQMATFSLWQDEECLRKFAYESPEHQEAIRRTRSLNWYKEELFARFQPYLSVGTWNGQNPVDIPGKIISS